MRFDPHDQIFHFRHTSFFSFFFWSAGCGVGGVGCGWWWGVCDPIFVFIKKMILSKWHGKTYRRCLSCEMACQTFLPCEISTWKQFCLRNRNHQLIRYRQLLWRSYYQIVRPDLQNQKEKKEKREQKEKKRKKKRKKRKKKTKFFKIY